MTADCLRIHAVLGSTTVDMLIAATVLGPVAAQMDAERWQKLLDKWIARMQDVILTSKFTPEQPQ